MILEKVVNAILETDGFASKENRIDKYLDESMLKSSMKMTRANNSFKTAETNISNTFPSLEQKLRTLLN